MISGPPSQRDKKAGKSKDLVPLQEVRKRLVLLSEEYRGIKAIPVDAIVGSADRSSQFTRKFKPRIPQQRDRMKQVALAYPSGDFPPIKVYQVGDAYFVRDGHIRVAAGKDMGVEFIDAEVTELETDESLSPDADLIDVIHIEQHRRLLVETELGEVRPNADLRVSRPSGYARFRELIGSHGYRLIQERQQSLTRREVAEHWYDQVYQPSIAAVRDSGVMAQFPHSTEADLFLWLERRRRSMVPNERKASLEDAVRQAAASDLSKEPGPQDEETP